MIQAGDWVTQYSAGFWQVLEILPKYAEEDYSGPEQSWKKGDRLGEWAILKKGMTAKGKPANGCEFVDARWCKPVPVETRQMIENMFAENSKAWKKFDQAPVKPSPMVTSIWLTLNEEQAEALAALLPTLPQRFPEAQFWARAEGYQELLADPAGATHVLYLFSYPWEMTDGFDLLHFGPELKRYA